MDSDRKLHLTPSQVQHLLIMRAVAERVQDTPYVLKGGAALILTRSLERYSSDLDFDSDRKLNLSGRIESALNSIREIEVRSIKLVKDTDTVQRYKIHYANKSTGDDTLLKIETSFRNSPPRQAIENVAGVKTYRVEYLFDQKLSAAMNRTEARDLYDLAFLVEQFGHQLRDEQIDAVQKFVENPDRLVDQYRLTFQIDEALNYLTKIEDVVLSLYLGVETLQSQRTKVFADRALEQPEQPSMETDPARMWNQYSQDINTKASAIIAVEAVKRAYSDGHRQEDILRMLTEDPQYRQFVHRDGGDIKAAELSAKAIHQRAVILLAQEQQQNPQQNREPERGMDGPVL